MLFADEQLPMSARADSVCDLYSLDHKIIQDVIRQRANLRLTNWTSLFQDARQIFQKDSSKHLHNHDCHNHHSFQWFSVERPMFLPDSPFRRRWDQCLVLALYVSAVEIPLRICFGWSSPTSVGWRILVAIFFGIDFVFRCRYFAFTQSHKVITHPTYIYRAYKSDGMAVDLISNIPLALIGDLMPKATSTSILFALRMGGWLRFLRMRRLASTLTRRPQAISSQRHNQSPRPIALARSANVSYWWLPLVLDRLHATTS